jgi:hypothetical protein
MALNEESQGDGDRSQAVDGWVVAFDREMAESGDFAATVAALSAHGCFDLRAVSERWILANPTLETAADGHTAPVAEPPNLYVVPEPVAPAGVATPPQEPEATADPSSLRPVVASSADVAHFHSLLQGGIDRSQLYEAFPAFRLVIDDAVAQHEADAPILSEARAAPTRADLNDEIRRTRQDLVDSGARPRRRWRSRD